MGGARRPLELTLGAGEFTSARERLARALGGSRPVIVELGSDDVLDSAHLALLVAASLHNDSSALQVRVSERIETALTEWGLGETLHLAPKTPHCTREA